MRKYFAALLVFLLGGVISAQAQAEKFICGVQQGRSPYPAGHSATHNHIKYAPAQTGLVKEFEAYVAQFDNSDDDTGDGVPDLLAIPEWVAYELDGVAIGEDGVYHEPDISLQRPGNWYEDDEQSFLWKNRPGITKKGIDHSYDGVGTIWNRGHYAMSDHAQRIGGEAACNTHHFWNAAPQAADFNQGNWKHLEDYSAAASNKFQKLWIITGPIIDRAKRYGVIGDPGEIPVAVPHAFFKIMIREIAPGAPDVLAFIFEQGAADSNGAPVVVGDWVNCNKANGQHYVYDPSPYLVKVADIESRTGLRFFRGLSAQGHDALAQIKATKLWPVEVEYWDPKSTCAGQRYVPPGPVP